MRYVENHLTKHHLFRAPHKWFFALLASPIHMAEMHYKKRYHLQFSHARKLFLFDLSLIGLLVVTLVAGIFWSTYNPTVTDLVYVTIQPSKDRIMSGEYVNYTIAYTNESDVRLTSAQLMVTVPTGFILDTTSPEEKFNKENNSFDIGSVDSGNGGSVSIAGWFYGTPNIEDYIHAEITYRQDGKTRVEKKNSPHIIFLRGSVLVVEAEITEQVVEGATIPFTLKLENNGEEILQNISFPLRTLGEIGTVENTVPSKGGVIDTTWMVGELGPSEKAELRGIVRVGSGLREGSYTVSLAPTIEVRGKHITQSTIFKKISVARPDARISVQWENEVGMLKPGETGRLVVSIVNTGTITLEKGMLEIPLPASLVNMTEAARSNVGTVSGNTLVLNSTKHSGLQSLSPGESRTIVVLIPIANAPDGGVDSTIQPSVRFRAEAVGVSHAVTDHTAEASPIKIGTQLIFTGEARYYTPEGDQLGRGPLPPEVGKETKYALLLTIKNTTSNVNRGSLTAKLPTGVVWTGKTSVTHGVAPQYNQATREVQWNIGTLPAHATAGLFAELSVTPGDADRGAVLRLLESAQITAFDTYLGYSLTRSIGSIEASLLTDSIGRAKGVLVR